jgi:hypothetical protein
MKSADKFFLSLALTILIAGFAGCSKSDEEKASAPLEKSEAPDKSGVIIDAATQERLGLKIATPAVLAWQPKIKCSGRVLVPAMLAAAVADLESARATMEVSSNEYARQKFLMAQNNASVRALETSRAAATRDELLFDATSAKFAMSWGTRLATGNNDELKPLIKSEMVLVQIDLPSGEAPKFTPRTAWITVSGDESVSAVPEFFDICVGVEASTQTQGFLYLAKDSRLRPGMAIVAELEDDSQSTNGVVVPDNAVLRHEGAGWVYVQTETNQFARTKIPLDRPTDHGWFVSENLSATNKIVVIGAQIILSAELSGGGFNTGERD